MYWEVPGKNVPDTSVQRAFLAEVAPHCCGRSNLVDLRKQLEDTSVNCSQCYCEHHYFRVYYYHIINTHGRFAIAFLPLTTRLSTELFEAVFIKKSSG